MRFFVLIFRNSILEWERWLGKKASSSDQKKWKKSIKSFSDGIQSTVFCMTLIIEGISLPDPFFHCLTSNALLDPFFHCLTYYVQFSPVQSAPVLGQGHYYVLEHNGVLSICRVLCTYIIWKAIWLANLSVRDYTSSPADANRWW